MSVAAHVCRDKRANIFPLKPHRGPHKNSTDHTQYAKCPHGPGGNIRDRKSENFNNPGDKEWKKKQDPALRPLAGLYWVIAIRAYGNRGNNAAFRKLIPPGSVI